MIRLLRRRPVNLEMSCGRAESVLWLTGPLASDDLGLPAALVADLDAWHAAWSRTAGLALVRDRGSAGYRAT